MNKIIIIGAGNMGLAIGKGLLKNSNNAVYFKTTHNTVIDKTVFDLEITQERIFLNDDINFFKDIQNPWIILAVKPHHVISVITEMNYILLHTNPKALISVAAGIDIKTISAACPENITIIRTMPNISVANGNGIIGYFTHTHSHTIKQTFIDLCTPLGMVYSLVSEEEFHLFTALAGSGPAFLFHTIEAMAQAAHKLDMDYQQAEKIAIQVFLGSASLLNHNSPTALRHAVTSLNGTTQAGLEILMNKSLNVSESYLAELFCKTFEAAKKRSQKII